jgi:hypothetical protein
MTIITQPQQQYLERVTQLYDQIQTWGKDQFNFAVQDPYPISDTTGDYPSKRLTVLRKHAQLGEESLVDFFPQGLTFLMGKGVVEVLGPRRDEELVYLREDNLLYTERRGFKEPVETGFQGEGWYLLLWPQIPTQVVPVTKEVFFDLVKTGADSFEEDLP